MEYRVFAHADIPEHGIPVELEDGLTEEEVEQQLFDVVSEYIDWHYEEEAKYDRK